MTRMRVCGMGRWASGAGSRLGKPCGVILRRMVSAVADGGQNRCGIWLRDIERWANGISAVLDRYGGGFAGNGQVSAGSGQVYIASELAGLGVRLTGDEVGRRFGAGGSWTPQVRLPASL
ncbi:hypothetical protein KCP74_00180 [Salmonella enterica subsp. enterica]|nr:hypothetical protein KCP74_00180 [Salmonella enterica subsp. enterica]